MANAGFMRPRGLKLADIFDRSAPPDDEAATLGDPQTGAIWRGRRTKGRADGHARRQVWGPISSRSIFPGTHTYSTEPSEW